MSNDKKNVNEFERLFKLWATVGKLILDGKRSVATVSEALQKIVEGVGDTVWRLHSPRPDQYLPDYFGTDLDKDLLYSTVHNMTMGPEDTVVFEWIMNPSTYPFELRENSVFLWKAQRVVNKKKEVCYMDYDKRCVVLKWRPLCARFGPKDLVLLKNS